MVDLIKSPGDPIWRQYVPDLQELEVHDGLVDSLAEDAHSPVPNITHRYPDRALFLVSPVCAAYCRFCTRRRKVGDPEKIPMAELESAFRYLEEHIEIRDVIMSGGDPLLLSDRRIAELCGRLRAIPHLEVIRIGSRVPCHLPERITPERCGGGPRGSPCPSSCSTRREAAGRSRSCPSTWSRSATRQSCSRTTRASGTSTGSPPRRRAFSSGNTLTSRVRQHHISCSDPIGAPRGPDLIPRYRRAVHPRAVGCRALRARVRGAAPHDAGRTRGAGSECHAAARRHRVPPRGR